MLSKEALQTIKELLNGAQMPVNSKTVRCWKLFEEVENALASLEEEEQSEEGKG